MIRITGENVNHHMDTVDVLRTNLEAMNQNNRDFDYCLDKGDFRYMNDMKKFHKFNKMPKAGAKKSSSMHNINTNKKHMGIKIGENSAINKMMQNMNKKVKKKPTGDDKVEIVNTLVGINGSMKEFSQELEGKLNRAFNSKAGRKFGMTKEQVNSYSKNKHFNKKNYDAVSNQAKEFLNNYKK